jgi:hypothetical protein
MKITKSVIGFGTFPFSVRLYWVARHATLLVAAFHNGAHTVWEIRFR